VFSVVLLVGLYNARSNLKNQDSAKSDCFCDFHAFSKQR